jgi:hypothetical protein
MATQNLYVRQLIIERYSGRKEKNTFLLPTSGTLRRMKRQERRALRPIKRGSHMLHGKPHILSFVVVKGFDERDKLVGEIKTRVKLGNSWITPKNGKKMLRELGAVYFTRENVWE